jgi:hypothetical protein
VRAEGLDSVVVFQDPSGNQTVTQPPGTFLSVNQMFIGAVSSLNNLIYVDGVKYPHSAAGIQAAINDAPSQGTVFLPPAAYTLDAVHLPIVISKGLRIVGSGWGTLLSVAADVTSDVFVVQPTGGAAVSNNSFCDLQIGAAAGYPARYGIHLDGTNGEVADLTIDHVYINQLGSFAVASDGSGNAQGTPVLSNIQNSVLFGGLYFANAGDTVRVLNNQITGAGPAVDVSFQGGASTFILQGNNITSVGGIHIGSPAVASQILSNEIETFPAFTGSNGALIDIDGPAYNVMIQNNSLQVVNGVAANGIRVNQADATLIQGNRFGRGIGASKDIVITGNATNTNVGTNMWVSGGPFSSMVSDSGIATVMAAAANGAFVLGNSRPLASLDESGNQQPLLSMASDGSVSLFGYHGQTLMTGVAGAVYLFDGSGTNTVMGTVSSAGLNVGGSSTGSVKLDGRGSFSLAAEAACLASGPSDRFLTFSAGTTQTCAQACAAVSCGLPGTCVEGWTMWPGTVHYRYTNECTVADPSGGQGISGKLCCCTGTGCATAMYR